MIAFISWRALPAPPRLRPCRTPRAKIADSHPKIAGSDPKFRNSDPKFRNSDPKFGISDPKIGDFDPKFGDFAPNLGGFGPEAAGPGRAGGAGAAGLAWAAALGLGLGKYLELREELELLRANFSRIWDSVQQDQIGLRFGSGSTNWSSRSSLLCRALGSSQRCGPGWLPHGSSCFSFSPDALSWGRALNACADLGAHLAVIREQEEQLFLLEHSNRSSSYWLGLRDLQRAGQWRWLTGEEPTVMFWDVWLQEEQRELGGCGALGPKGRWVSVRCSEPLRWVCQRPNRC
ncbi:C-type lectin domain family 17, member A-like [Agelaius phoeniceus]|uniref:C-type lectin domain family 17, member A-like n=1 Tax=Agelaius phoeniceus TaxID=39638 RepID=UPI0040551156